MMFSLWHFACAVPGVLCDYRRNFLAIYSAVECQPNGLDPSPIFGAPSYTQLLYWVGTSAIEACFGGVFLGMSFVAKQNRTYDICLE